MTLAAGVTVFVNILVVHIMTPFLNSCGLSTLIMVSPVDMKHISKVGYNI